ncbi:hypothetical protein APHAL10511_006919 [Amanita phalloides]|nr:hypothetical protein APHAL10511_006919 [Amanita phalloides]
MFTGMPPSPTIDNGMPPAECQARGLGQGEEGSYERRTSVAGSGAEVDRIGRWWYGFKSDPSLYEQELFLLKRETPGGSSNEPILEYPPPDLSSIPALNTQSTLKFTDEDVIGIMVYKSPSSFDVIEMI